ncbi:IS110 family transposase [Arthrobacter bambusae]|uniref:IS110 family transposase n=1 Tax=Arthrobacter bambusae TaxID=1338426 RepID=UPI001F50F394|nr:IS110 family transposase [Arthrobacter bambusae]
MAKEHLKVIAGIDTHADTHHVAIITETGRHLADRGFPAAGSGYRGIIDFMNGFGPVLAVGVEGTGSYGAELSRVLTREGMHVVEVTRPNRQARRLQGKSDPLDAYQAAESVLAGHATATPKSRDGAVESLRVLRAERATAMRARIAVMAQAKAILVTAPETIRARYRGMRSPALMAALVKARPVGAPSDPLTSTATVLKRLAVSYRHLHQELALIDAELDAILTLHAPMLRDLPGVGTDVASQLLVTVGDNPERVTTEAKFAALVGVAPIPASSRKTTRHRLSRAGDRQANKAIHHVVLVRMRWDSRTRAYVARRRQEGKSTKEIMRCLKRYVARELYEQLLHPHPGPDPGTLRTVRTAKHLTLQQAADALHVWPTTLSRLERGLSHDNDFHHRYETWLTAQSPETVQTPHHGLARGSA